ncbi:hypothetical protein N7644_03770 [Acinetobacter courvalinii]|uniref:Uncharacterized protein n=1 Tax=Acinetobacter courvalinii TaxID=280147 RepID=A0AA42I7M0_9GAMM|nr:MULTISPECIES: hypothetical protein [Acinetobacter]MDH0562797.1 hypothetical protein [Acinetobacter courvalinii]
MNIIKFLKSFNTMGFYLTVASIVLLMLIVYFYFINPN